MPNLHTDTCLSRPYIKHIIFFLSRPFSNPVRRVSLVLWVLCQVAHRHTFQDHNMKMIDSTAKDYEYVHQKVSIDKLKK